MPGTRTSPFGLGWFSTRVQSSSTALVDMVGGTPAVGADNYFLASPTSAIGGPTVDEF